MLQDKITGTDDLAESVKSLCPSERADIPLEKAGRVSQPPSKAVLEIKVLCWGHALLIFENLRKHSPRKLVAPASLGKLLLWPLSLVLAFLTEARTGHGSLPESDWQVNSQ